MLVDEGGQAMFFHVSSGQSATPGRSEELNNIIRDVVKEDELVPKLKRQDFVKIAPLHCSEVSSM